MKAKKLVALLVCAVLAMGMTGCVGNLYDIAGSIDGTEISGGLYMMAEYSAYYEARGKVEDTEKDVLKQKVDGQGASGWIQTRTEELLRKYVAVQRLCREENITISSEGQQNVESMLQYWSWMEEAYAANGIAQSTYVRYLTNEQLASQLFTHLYGEGGERAMPDEEMKAKYGEQNAHIRYLTVPTASEEEGAADVVGQVEEATAAVAEKLNNGAGTLEAVAAKEFGVLYELTGREFDPSTVADSVMDNYVDYVGVDYYDEAFLAALKEQAVGDFGYYNMGANIIVYEKIETFTSDEEFENMRQSVIEALCRDDFEAYLKSVYDTYTTEWRFGAKNFYRPGKLET